jgi:D-beta-D-heptose 7-phosphate kinase/D-beta-D-heptose 1-phosphate adenosyltransferase
MTFDTSKFSRCKLLVAGDLMIDEYVWGEVDRISPEAPVQVVSVSREDYTLGGAGNVINNLSALGGKVWAAGVIGHDNNGRVLLEKLAAMDADTRAVVVEPERPTTVKTRIIAAHQHVLRIDRETRRTVAESTFAKLAKIVDSALKKVDCVIISDYGKGLFTPAFLNILITAARKAGKPVVVDPKGTDFKKYGGASLITPNRKEAGLAAGIDIVDHPSLVKAGNKLLKSTGVDKILITLGKDGMILFEPRKKPYKVTAEARQVFDVSGAGDTVVAVLALTLAAGGTYREALTLANAAAGLVVAKVGTAVVSQAELQAALQPTFETTAFKYVAPQELPRLANDLKRRAQRIVLTNGCLDLLHAGHIAFFSEAKKLGDVLIVAIDDDELVAKIKGAGRPVIRAKERVRMISALDVVDHVVVFSDGQLQELIETVQPNVLTKGSNYKHDTVFGHEIVERLGGRVVLIPIDAGISASGIINKIKNGQ